MKSLYINNENVVLLLIPNPHMPLVGPKVTNTEYGGGSLVALPVGRKRRTEGLQRGLSR